MKKKLLYNGALILLLLVNSSVLMAQWTKQNTGFTAAYRSISQISIVDENVVWASALDGTTGKPTLEYTRTTNGGNTWAPGTITFPGSTGYYLTNLHAISAMKAFAALPPIAATGGKIAQTIDGGANWNTINSPDFSASWLNWVHFFDANNGVCMGDADASGDFVIYTTNNGGTSWTKVGGANIPNAYSGENGRANIYDYVGNSIWFTTGKDRVYSSSDRGLTWSVSSPGIVLTAVKFRTQLNGIAYGSSTPVGANQPDIRKTNDGGKTWEKILLSGFYLKNLTRKSLVGELANVPGTTTWFNTAGYSKINGSSYSFDDGVSYFNIDTTSTNLYTCAKFLNAQTGWAGSFNTNSTDGGIYKWCSLATPTIGIITQPLTSSGTGSVVLNNLPASGLWKIENVTTSANTSIASGIGNSTTVSSLAPGRYRFRVNYGGCLSMVTEEIVISAMTQATNITFTNVTDNSMRVNWTRGTGDKVLVLARRGSAVNSNMSNLVDSPGEPFAESIFGLGSQIGALNWIVYNGTDNFVDVTGLLAGVDYHFAVYEYSYSKVSSGSPAVVKINTNYLVPALVGNVSTTTNFSDAPCVNFNYLASNAVNELGTYTEILGDEILTADFVEENAISPTDIGFDFKYNCQTFNKFVLNTNGFIKLGDQGALNYTGYYTLDNTGGSLNRDKYPDYGNGANVNIIHAFNHALTGIDGVTKYSVSTTGNIGSRVCTIQFKNVKEAIGSYNAPTQFSNMNFQIKLYETTNVIEVVYGDFTFSSTAITLVNKFKTATCGLRGSSLDNSQSLIVNKLSETTDWSTATFSNNIVSGSGIFFANINSNTAAKKPEKGRTFKFVPTPNNDLAVGQIYSMGEASSKLSNNQKISVVISNPGLTDVTNAVISLNVSGVSTVSETKTISLKAGELMTVNFTNFAATTSGSNTITVSVPSDGNNLNNTKTWIQYVTDYVCNYSTTTDLPSTAYGNATNGTGGAFFVKYTSSSSHSQVEKVKVFIYNFGANTGKTIQAVVLNDANVKIGESASYVITSADLGTWKEFALNSPAVITNGVFYAGIKFAANAAAYFPVGIQTESTIRRGTYYYSAFDLNGFTEYSSASTARFMIGATLSEIPAPVAGIVSSSAPSVCSGNTVTLTLAGYTGNIKWQKSLDNGVIWTDVPSSASSTLITPAITASTSFRAVVSQNSFTDVNSNQVDIVVNLPVATFTGGSYLCPGVSTVQLTASVLSGVSYEWSAGSSTLGASASYSATEAGNYSLKVTDLINLCSAVSTPKVITSTASSKTISFDAVSVCSGQVPIIPTTSKENITGSWSPSFVAITTPTQYTFTADVNECITSPTFTFDVTVNALPTASITAGGTTTFCSGSSVTLSASTLTGVSYEWKKDGSKISQATSDSYTASTAGSYSLKVTESINKCSAESTPIIVVVNTYNLPTASITAGGTTTFCSGSDVTLTASVLSGASYEWINGSTTINGANLANYTANLAGNYTLKLTDLNSNCSQTSPAIVVKVNPIITPDFTPVSVCSGDLVAIRTVSPNGIRGSWSPSFAAITSPTVYTFTASPDQCVSYITPFTLNVTVNALPTASISTGGDLLKFCSGSSVTLTSSTANSYLWSTGATSASISVATPGKYKVQVTGGNNCKNISSETVVEPNYPLPTATISASNGAITFCQGNSVTLTSSPAISYLWSTGSTLASISTAIAGNYTVEVTDNNGCKKTSSVTAVTVNALPTATITATGNTSFCQGGSVELSSSTGTSYEWKQGTTVLSTTTKTFSSTTAGSYTVKVTDGNGCTKVSDAIDLKLLDCTGLEELTFESINTYPNPTVGKLNLFTSVELINANVQLVDIAGKVVYSSKMNFKENSSTEFDFNELSNGNYILKVNEYQTKVVINK